MTWACGHNKKTQWEHKEEEAKDEEDHEFEGPQGTQTGNFFTSTLPSREGPYEFMFKFYKSCHVWNLHQPVGGGLERVAWYEKLPDQQVY